jgi:hypothetical protein
MGRRNLVLDNRNFCTTVVILSLVVVSDACAVDTNTVKIILNYRLNENTVKHCYRLL